MIVNFEHLHLVKDENGREVYHGIGGGLRVEISRDLVLSSFSGDKGEWRAFLHSTKASKAGVKFLLRTDTHREPRDAFYDLVEIARDLGRLIGLDHLPAKYYVQYELQDNEKTLAAGPYNTRSEAEAHQLDMTGYIGVHNPRVVVCEEGEPPEPKSALDRILEDEDEAATV